MLKIDKLPLVEEDLIDIWIYGCKTWGSGQADTYSNSIENTLSALIHLPKKHRIRKSFRPPIRICPHISHMIIYALEENSITIIRVLHKSMDVNQHI